MLAVSTRDSIFHLVKAECPRRKIRFPFNTMAVIFKRNVGSEAERLLRELLQTRMAAEECVSPEMLNSGSWATENASIIKPVRL